MLRQKSFASFATVTLTSVLVGCGSLVGTFDPTISDVEGGGEFKENRIYAGTRVDTKIILAPFEGKGPGWDQSFWAFYPFLLIDLPLSLIADTLLLPYTVPLYYYKNKQHSPSIECDSKTCSGEC